MRRIPMVIAAAPLAAAGLVTTAGPASAEERTCRGRIGATTVDNLRVPDGASCVLRGTVVKGTVNVGTRAKLNAENITVIGDVQSEGHRRVVVRSSRVDGS